MITYTSDIGFYQYYIANNYYHFIKYVVLINLPIKSAQ